MPHEEVPGIAVDVWIRTSDSHLEDQRVQTNVHRGTYKMKHCASEDGVDREAHATQHAQQARHSVRLQDCFLQFAHSLRSGVACHHVLFPDAIIRLCHRVDLWSEVHYNCERLVAVQVCNVMRWNPRRRIIQWVRDLKIIR